LPSSRVDCAHRDVRNYCYPFVTSVAVGKIPLEFGNRQCSGTKFVLQRIPNHWHGISWFIWSAVKILEGQHGRLLKIAVPGEIAFERERQST